MNSHEPNAAAGQPSRRMRPMRALSARLAEKAEFADTKSWLTYCYHRLAARYRGLPGAGSVVSYRPAGYGKPVAARLGRVDFIIGHHMFAMREYRAAEELDLGAAPFILDLGSNVGMSLRVWLHSWPNARIAAVEPDAENRSVAQRTIELAGAAGQVSLLAAACVGQPRPVMLQTEGLDPSMYEVAEGAPDGSRNGSGAIDGLTVPMILERAGAPADQTIDLLKCDIEGSEAEVFAGCAPWIGSVRNILIEIHGDYTQDKFEADLARAGWTAANTRVLLDFDGGRVLLLERG